MADSAITTASKAFIFTRYCLNLLIYVKNRKNVVKNVHRGHTDEQIS